MELWEAKVSCYNKKQRGKTTLQCEIRLNKGHPFIKDEEVGVVKVEEIKTTEEELRELKEEVNRLKEANVKLTLDSNDTLRKLTVASQVVNQYKEVMKTQETILAIYTNRGFMDRLRNKPPEEVTQLVESKTKLVKLEDSNPVLIEVTTTTADPEGKGK
jgi:ribosomal protein L17